MALEWWQANDQEVSQVTNMLHFAESMANDRGWVIALTKEMRCKPQQYCRRVDILEIVRPSNLPHS
jgi:hypothetical protein